MEVIKFEVGPFMENTYLLLKDGEAVLIDPGFAVETEYASFIAKLDESGATLKAVLLTHAHVDHVMGLQRTLKDFDVPVYLNTRDMFLWENYGSQATMFGLNQVDFSFTPEPLPADKSFEAGKFSFQCLFTPGHAPDHTAFYFKDEQLVIAGDVLFRESIGRTDLYKGSFEVLEQSIRQKMYTLPDDTMVYPGHGPETTIGHEKQHNPFVS